MGFEEQKPTIILIGCQFMYSAITLTGRAALLQDMSSLVFVFYRQCVAFLIIAPIAFFIRRETKSCYLGWKNFWWISLLSFVGITLNQNIFFEGVYLASSSVASALLNLVPAITFVMAYSMGMEKVNLRSARSVAKIIGTLFCVAAAFSMAFLKGPKLLNMEIGLESNSLLQQGGNETWLLGCFLLFGSACCWSVWLVLLAHVSASYEDHVSLTAWMFLLSALQSGILTLIFAKDMSVWKLKTSLAITCCLCAGMVSSMTFFAQAWCTSRRGALFSAMFNPLGTVIVTAIACLFLHEELYTGSFVGALAVIIGLYTVLWGKAKDHKCVNEETVYVNQALSSGNTNHKIDLEIPFCLNKHPPIPEKTKGIGLRTNHTYAVWVRYHCHE